jgi:hypothetical protein
MQEILLHAVKKVCGGAGAAAGKLSTAFGVIRKVIPVIQKKYLYLLSTNNTAFMRRSEGGVIVCVVGVDVG